MISRHFKRIEFVCACGCGKDTVDAELLTVLEWLRCHFNAPVLINSANRCEEHNKQVGGKKSSQHLLSKAADVRIPGIPPYKVYTALNCKYSDQYGIGRYEAFTHIDSRSRKARW